MLYSLISFLTSITNMYFVFLINVSSVSNINRSKEFWCFCLELGGGVRRAPHPDWKIFDCATRFSEIKTVLHELDNEREFSKRFNGSLVRVALSCTFSLHRPENIPHLPNKTLTCKKGTVVKQQTWESLKGSDLLIVAHPHVKVFVSRD